MSLFLGFWKFGGLAADLDILIYSKADPLLFLSFHRQFTHSFLFIPFGGLSVALLVHSVMGRHWKLSFVETVFLCSKGTLHMRFWIRQHPYGTMLLWPFNEIRYSWNIISIVDPLFSLPLILFVSMTAARNNPFFARIGVVWALFYLGVGWWQHQGALEVTKNLTASRGHLSEHILIKPSFL